MGQKETGEPRVLADGTYVVRRRKRRHRSSSVLGPIAEPRIRMFLMAAAVVIVLSVLLGLWVAVAGQR